MKKIIIIANSKWFIINFKYWLIEELSKKHFVKAIFLSEGPKNLSEDVYKSKGVKFVKLEIFKFILEFFSRDKYRNILAFTIFGLVISPIIYPFASNKIAVIEGLGKIFSSRKILYRILKRFIIIYYRLIFSIYYDKIVVLNYTDINYLLDLGITEISKIKYIPGTGIDLKAFSKKNMERSKVNKGKINVGMISRFIIEKGINKYIASKIALINQNFQISSKVNYFLIIPKKDIAKINKKNLSLLADLNIKLLEYSKNPIEIYQNIDIIVNPTNYFEGLNRVILEAGSLEIPIIATKNRGIDDIIPNEEYGYLIDKNGSPLEICLKIKKIIENPQDAKEKSKKLREHIEKNFSIEIASKKFLDLIK